MSTDDITIQYLAGMREAAGIVCDGCRRGRPLARYECGQNGVGKDGHAIRVYSYRHPDSTGDAEGEWSDSCRVLDINYRIAELEGRPLERRSNN